MGRKVRFIHSGDAHLGSVLCGGENFPGVGESLRNAVSSAFTRVIDAAVHYQVDFLLLSGDIYDAAARSVTANQLLAEQCSRLDQCGIPVFMIHGNHDPLAGARQFVNLPANVEVFGHEAVEYRLAANRDNTVTARVMGQSYRNSADGRPMHLSFQPPRDGLINIGMLHTAMNRSGGSYVPCSLAELLESNVDYWALGHRHRPEIVHLKDAAVIYAGIPQGRDVNEWGMGGCLLVEAEKGSTPEVSFVPTAPVVMLTCALDVEQAEEELHTVDDLARWVADRGKQMLGQDPPLPDGFTYAKGARPEVDGYVVRWVIGGRGSIHKEIIAGNEGEVAALLEEQLRHLLSGETPFLWTESVRLHTQHLMPDLQSLAPKDQVMAALLELAGQVKESGEARDRLKAALGGIWQQTEDREEARADAFALTAERLDEILDGALRLVAEELLERRGEL